jgi:aspartate/methionine/tyrosine aminotransferase
MKEIPLSGIKIIEDVIRANKDYISLSQGSMKIGGIPQYIKHYVQTLMATDITDYYGASSGLLPFREKIVALLSTLHKTPFKVEQILPTHGCAGGLSLVYNTLLSPGDEVIIPEPTYPAYGLLCKATQSVPVFVSCLKNNPDGSHAWEFDIEKIQAAITPKTKLIVFSNPVNPLGLVVPLTTILELLTICEQKGIYLLVDEAYKDFAFTDRFQSTAPYVLESQFLIQANTFSKNMAMSGWRIGYLVVPPNLLQPLSGMQDVTLNCINNISQYAAMYTLDHPELSEYFKTVVRENRNHIITAFEPLVRHGIMSFTIPEASFYLFAKTTLPDATELCMKLLHEAKVGVIPGKSFGPSGAPFMRICFAREPEILHEGIKRILAHFGF